jgi:hypothetical protein
MRKDSKVLVSGTIRNQQASDLVVTTITPPSDHYHCPKSHLLL